MEVTFHEIFYHGQELLSRKIERSMQNLQIIEQDGIRVLTSKQLAEAYNTTTERIKQNFQANRSRYVEQKHYICLSKNALREFKNRGGNSSLVSNRANILYLWTEKGALLHAKSLNTDKAWEVYDYLVDFYFRAKETAELKENLPVPVGGDEQKLVEGDVRVLAYNRGIVLGALRCELEEDSTLEIYERLSASGKGMVMKMLFGEVSHAQ